MRAVRCPGTQARLLAPVLSAERGVAGAQARGAPSPSQPALRGTRVLRPGTGLRDAAQLPPNLPSTYLLSSGRLQVTPAQDLSHEPGTAHGLRAVPDRPRASPASQPWSLSLRPPSPTQLGPSGFSAGPSAPHPGPYVSRCPPLCPGPTARLTIPNDRVRPQPFSPAFVTALTWPTLASRPPQLCEPLQPSRNSPLLLTHPGLCPLYSKGPLSSTKVS